MNPVQIQSLYACFGQHVSAGTYEWVNGHCPLAPWTHAKGTDNTPSFGLRVNSSGESIYKCWSCDKVGTVTDLVYRLIYLAKTKPKNVHYNMSQAVQLIADENEHDDLYNYSPLDYEDNIAAVKEFVFPQGWLNSFFPMASHPYLTERGISVEVATLLDLRVDIVDKRICFPISSFDGRLLGLQGRTFADSPMRYRLYEYQGHFNPHIWGNENRVSLDEPLVLTEGFFDLAKIAMVYENVMCSFTSSLSSAKLNRIRDADCIITYYDIGTGGDVARAKLDSEYPNKYIRHIVPDEVNGDAGASSPELIRTNLKKLMLI